MIRVEFGCGTGFDWDNKPLPPEHVDGALDVILRNAARIWGGGNFVRGYGFWKNPKGDLVVEPSCTLVVDVESLLKGDVTYMVGLIKGELRQHSIHVVEIPLAHTENI